MRQLRGRFAPSPSGEMHLGNIWTALLAWLAVRSAGGIMVLRMEDLDPDRSRPQYARQIMADLHWLGLDWDEGPDIGGPYAPYTQDERRDCYEAAVRQLTEQGAVYPCYCSRADLHAAAQAPHAGETELRYAGTCRQLSGRDIQKREQRGRQPSLRVRVPDRVIAYHDVLQGEVQQNVEAACGDFLIRRADGVHAYQLAVVVDDALMAVTQVVRGADLMSSTPRQLLLYEMLGHNPPDFAHVPLLYGQDGHRLSKRQQSLSLAAMKQQGISPEAIIGFLAWKAGLLPRQEAVRARDLIAGFSFAALSRDAVIIDALPGKE